MAGRKKGEQMSETAKMWIWMAIALIDTFIIINNNMKDKER